ncbi:hypothetical protein [Rhizobium laguerreae]|uniref:hypothetical protein n=1 Tax=Rhizobium laguerreae TaxID=1076926 RepID=UPI001C92565F|nr:hypothetical protein [Rhizobium laguerreae]MBY3314680.1 hypothetical protein [Rhizobium laguerreae]
MGSTPLDPQTRNAYLSELYGRIGDLTSRYQTGQIDERSFRNQYGFLDRQVSDIERMPKTWTQAAVSFGFELGLGYLASRFGGSKALTYDDVAAAQSDYARIYSREGRAFYSQLAGRPIKTVGDLASAIRAGEISPSSIPVTLVARDGIFYAINTRTMMALREAGVNAKDIKFVPGTYDDLANILLDGQLGRNAGAPFRFSDIPSKCFPGSTLIQTGKTSHIPISELRSGDVVLAFDPSDNLGRGSLVPRRVARIFHSVTTEWVRLCWMEDGSPRELVATPGHHFLDQFGNFPTIEEMLNAGTAIVILASGELATVTAERIVYSTESAHLFERATMVEMSAGSAARRPEKADGWQTYNFEVEDLHTYIADGVRVHNMSDPIAHNWRGVDDFGSLAVAFDVPGYGSRFLDGDALDHYYNSMGGAHGVAGTSFGWGLASALTAQATYEDSFLSQAVFSTAYMEKAGISYSEDFDSYIQYNYRQYVQTTDLGHRSFAGFSESLGPARYGEAVGSPEHIADRAFAAGHGFLGAYAAASGVSVYSDQAYQALDKHRALNQERLSGSSGKSGGGEQTTKSNSGSKTGSSGKPVLLDLSGGGLNIDPLSSSSKFVDLDGDGYQHRTAWAAQGTGVLVLDADGDGKISRSSEFIFTEWDSSATGDLEALKHVFDTNANGKLDAGDAQWLKFRVEVNGQLVALDSLGITSIDLTPKGSGQTFEDGSAINGTTTFTRADGTTGMVGDATLANDDAAYLIKTSAVTKADGSVEKTILAYNKDGSLAFRNVMTTSADGKSVQTQFDDDGNGTFDRSQTNVLTVDASGLQTKTVSNFNADGSLLDRTKTVTSADRLTVTATLDKDGDGIVDQRQTFVQNGNGSNTTTDVLSANGALLRSTKIESAASGLVKTTSLDRDGNGTYDNIVTETTTVAADGNRSKTTKEQSSSGKTLSAIYKTTSADGRTISTYTDSDGNGPSETRTDTISTVAADTGTVTLEATVYNTNASFIRRSKTTTITSANGLSKTVKSDVNADNINDFTDTDVTVIDATNRTQTVQHRSRDNTLLSQTITKTSIDGKSITIAEDANGDGKNDQFTEILIGADGKTTNTVSNLNYDTSLVSKTVTVTSADGLSKTASTDANGDGIYDLVVSDVITNEADGSRTETVTSKNANGATIATTITNTSADSLTQTVKTDADGDGLFEESTKDTTVLDGSGKRTETVSSTSANGTLNAQSINEISADRRTTTVWTDADGDGKIDRRQVKVIGLDGSTTTTETAYTPNDTVTGTTRSTVVVSGNGLTTTTSVDLNRDSLADRITTDQTVLNTDGSTTETIALKSSNATLLDKKTIVTSGNGKSITTSEDLNGDGIVDIKTTDVTTFDTYGKQFQAVSNFRGTTLVGSTKVTTNLNGLDGATDYDLDGDGTFNQTLSWKKTPLDPTGAVTTAETLKATDTNATLLSQKITSVSADQKTTTITSKIDADTVVDRLETITIDNAGTMKDDVKQYNAAAVLESQSVITTYDDGLTKTSSSDLDGNGIFELVITDITALNADGSRTETVSKNGIGDALISRTTSNVSASGLSKTINWADATDTVVRSMSDVTVLNADGGTTETLSYFKAGGVLESKTVTTVAAHQLSTTVTSDVDGDNNVDKKSVTTKQADGSTIQLLSDFGANAVLKDTKKVTTSADSLTQTIEYDTDGNATVDKKTTSSTVLNANGSKTTTVKNIVGSVTKSITVSDVSGDGLTTTTKWDTAGTGGGTSFNKSRTDVTVLNADGSRTRTISDLTGTTLTSRTLVSTTANGLSITTQIDPTGAGSYSQTATDVTVLNADGTKTRTVESKKSDGSLISRTITAISANGLIIASSEERPGFANQTVRDATTMLADGAVRETVETKDGSGAVTGKVTKLTSADRLTVTVDRDRNGDGVVEQRQETITADSGIQTSVTTDFNANGTIKDKSISVVSADGRQTSTIWDLDGNGTIDRQRVVSFTANADGSSTTVMTDANLPNGPLVANTPPGYPNTNLPNSTLAAKTTIQTSADGKVKTTSKDINGDGTPDQVETVTVDSTGASVSLVTNNATAQKVSNLTPGVVYWTQAIAAKIETTTSADGRTKTAKYDYDGNGVYEAVMQSTIQVDGSIVTAITQTNSGGTVTAKGTIATSADGLITTLSKDTDNNGTIDHTETAVTHADGSVTLTKVDLNSSGTMTQTVVDQIGAFGSLSSSITTDALGQKTKQIIVAGDGSSVTTTYDGPSGQTLSVANANKAGLLFSATFYDALKTATWARIEQLYDPAGRLLTADQYNDDSTHYLTTYDPAGVENWSRHEKAYNSANVMTNFNLYYDNGVQRYYVYDAAGTQTWSSYLVIKNSAGQTTEQDNYFDNGLTDQYIYDVSNSATWSSQINSYAASGALMHNFIQWDEVKKSMDTWYDYLGNKPWIRDILRYDNYGVRTSGDTYFDDGTRIEYEYHSDQGGKLDWWKRYDAQGRVVETYNPPVLLDLNGDSHIDLRPLDELGPSVGFDWDGDGMAEETAWVGPQDGFLAIDLGADERAGPDGKIDQARELAFSLWDNEATSDLDGLRLAFDTNHDNVLDVTDDRWSEFRVWRDINQNGVSDAGELQTMTDAGIRLINLMPSRDGMQSFADGSIITGTSSYQTVDGNQNLVGDAVLAFRPNRTADAA